MKTESLLEPEMRGLITLDTEVKKVELFYEEGHNLTLQDLDGKEKKLDWPGAANITLESGDKISICLEGKDLIPEEKDTVRLYVNEKKEIFHIYINEEYFDLSSTMVDSLEDREDVQVAALVAAA